MDIIKESGMPDYKVEHTLIVTKVAIFLANKLKEKGEEINVDIVESGSLLHDIAKDAGKDHDIEGARKIKEMGFDVLEPVIRKHAFTRVLEYPLETWEEKLVFYADKRVASKPPKIVSLNERTAKWNMEGVSEAMKITKEIEKEIFSKLDIKPEDIVE